MGFLSYLLMHIWLCLLAAALLGGFLMWLVSKFFSSNLREELETLWGGKVRDAEARAGALGVDLIRVEGKLSALEAQIGDWKTKFAALEAEKVTLVAGLAAAQGQIPGFETEIGNWKAKFAALESEKAKLLAGVATAEGRLPGLEAQIGDWQTKFAALEADKANVASGLVSAQGELGEWQTRFSALEGEKSGLAGKLSSLVSEHQIGIAAAAAAAGAAGLAATAKFAVLADEKRELEASFDQARKAHADQSSTQEARLAGFATQVAELTQERDQNSVRIHALTTEIDAAKHTASQHSLQLQQVAQERDQYSMRVRGLTDELAAARQTMGRQTGAPLAMAAAAGAASSVTVAPPVSDEWQPKYHDLEARFRSFVIGQQREGYGDIERIEGIGPVFGQKLRQAGMAWVKTLLAEGGSALGRKAIVEATGLTSGDILRWVNVADLLRIEGVTPDWAEMLEVAGVDTVKELRNRVPANLHQKMVETRAENPRQFHSDAPSLEQIQAWIAAAKIMEPAVTH